MLRSLFLNFVSNNSLRVVVDLELRITTVHISLPVSHQFRFLFSSNHLTIDYTVSGVVAAMLDVLDDKCEIVRQSVFESIREIARVNPTIVVHASLYYLELHPKVTKRKNFC